MKYSSVQSDELDQAIGVAKMVREEYLKDKPDFQRLADMAADLSDLVLQFKPESIPS